MWGSLVEIKSLVESKVTNKREKLYRGISLVKNFGIDSNYFQIIHNGIHKFKCETKGYGL